MAKKNPKVDAYISRAAEFAAPILNRLRGIVHAACPKVEETLKWGCPHFTYSGKILCSMAAFRQHCSFGFWHSKMAVMLDPKLRGEQSMDPFRRITKLGDLLSKADLTRLVYQAMQLIDEGSKVAPRVKKQKPAMKVPDDLRKLLAKNKQASAAFAAFSPSHRREYIQWIVEAKRPETRQKRLKTTMSLLVEGKHRNWKYENC